MLYFLIKLSPYQMLLKILMNILLLTLRKLVFCAPLIPFKKSLNQTFLLKLENTSWHGSLVQMKASNTKTSKRKWLKFVRIEVEKADDESGRWYYFRLFQIENFQSLLAISIFSVCTTYMFAFETATIFLNLSAYAPPGCYWQVTSFGENVIIFFLIWTLWFDSSAKSSDFFTGILIPHYPSVFNTLISVYKSELCPRLVCFQKVRRDKGWAPQTERDKLHSTTQLYPWSATKWNTTVSRELLIQIYSGVCLTALPPTC